MKTLESKQPAKQAVWPRKVPFGRTTVTVYRRANGSGNFNFMVANYADGKRRFDSYADEATALQAADTLAKRLSQRDVLAASMTREQAVEYTSAAQGLAPFNVTLPAVAATAIECLKMVGDLPSMTAACKFFADRKLKKLLKKKVPDVVAEFLASKREEGAALAYLKDLTSRLSRFAADFQMDICNVTTADIQDWLDKKKCSPTCYMDFRRRLSLLFGHAKARNYCDDNPAEGVQSKKKIRAGKTEIFTPEEIAKLLAAAPPDFVPVVAIGAFCGVRSAEIQRLEWSDIDLAGRMITINADASKTASRRLIPVSENLVRWLEPYAGRQGKVWTGGQDAFHHQGQEDTAKAAGVRWKPNGLRHSFCSYRLAIVKSAPQVALEAGNSPAMVFKHYRELVKESDAERWFNVRPEAPANVMAMPAAASA